MAKKLSNLQQTLIDALVLNYKEDEQVILDRHKIGRRRYRRWLSQPAFVAELERGAAGARKRAVLLAARHRPEAVCNLVHAMRKKADGEFTAANRRASLDLFAWSFWTFDSNGQRAVDWLEEFGRIAGSMGNGHRYQNYPRRGNPDFRKHYFGTNLGRLMDIKLKYDPHNLFDYEQGLLHDGGKAGEAAT